MNRVLLLLVYFWLTMATQISAQPTYSIRGSVMDQNGGRVSFASAALYNVTDSALVTGDVSNEQGRFEIAAEQGASQIVAVRQQL